MMKRLIGALCAALLLATSPAPAAEQSSYVMPTTGPMSLGTFVNTYLNPGLRAIASCHNGASAPGNGPSSSPLAYQCWIDTTANPAVYKIYDGASWITLGTINTSTHVWSVYGSLANATGLPISTGVSGLGSNVATFLGTPSSANLAGALTDETGSGAAVFATSPALTTPNLGTPSAVTLTNATGLPIGSGVSGLGSNVATFLGTPSSANLAGALTDETGSGAAVFATSPALTTPNLGTPSAVTLTNATGLPIGSGVSGLGTNVATFLGTPSSANLAAAVTGETGSGALVFGTAPNITSPTGIVKGDVGLGNVDNTSDATKNAASVTLTNKTISGAANTLSAIALSSLASQANNTVVGNVSGGSAAPIALSATQLTTLCNVFSASLNGCVTAPGTATGKLLRDDGTWVTVSGSGTVTSVSVTAGTGITQSGSPVTGSGSITVNVDKATSSNYYAATSNKVVTTDVIYPSEVTVTYGATTTFDFDSFINGAVTLTGNITTQTLSNVRAGKSGTITFIQDGTGSRTTVWNSIFKWAGGTSPSLSTAASAVDVLSYSCRTTTFCTASLLKDVK